MKKEIKEVVRVGLNNNFNCTPEEFKQVKGFQLLKSDAYFFVNSNIKTPELLAINDHKVNVVVTVNPDIVIDRSLVEKLYKLNQKKVSFVRVRYIPNDESIKSLIMELSGKGYNVVITVMRFKSNESVNKYSKKENYNYAFSWFRLNKNYFEELEQFADSLQNVYICDRNGVGCSGCNLCSSLNVGKDVITYGLNLSSSGVCPFSCPDCFAKKMQIFLTAKGSRPINYNVVKQNAKQVGTTAHIKEQKRQQKKAA